MPVINRYNGLYWLLCHPGYCHYLSVQEPHNQKEETKSYAAEWGFPPNPRTSPRNPATGNQCHVHNPCICYQQQGNVANVKECKTFPNHLNQIFKKIKSPFILLSVWLFSLMKGSNATPQEQVIRSPEHLLMANLLERL